MIYLIKTTKQYLLSTHSRKILKHLAYGAWWLFIVVFLPTILQIVVQFPIEQYVGSCA